MDYLNWFKISVIYPLTSSFSDEELSEVDQIRLRNEGLLDDYETDTGVYNLSADPIVQLNPKAFIPKGKVNKKFYTEMIFQSGNITYALGKPDSVYEKINEYLNGLPEETPNNS